jgi:murein DD-endopeptidase MepM/ murein hydrolase activator NlpD
LKAATGERVASIAAGTVDGIRAVDPGKGYGIYIRTRHEVGGVIYKVWYGHLKSIAPGLVVGSPVTAGQFIGIADNSGVSTGSHLHLTLQMTPGGLSGYIVDSVIDPTPFLEKFK